MNNPVTQAVVNSSIGLIRRDDAHYWGNFYLGGKLESIDLTAILGVGIDDRINEENPRQLFVNLDLIGGWRYTLYQSWIEAKQRLEEINRQFESWQAQKYLDAERDCQESKAIQVASKTRSMSEQITKTTIESNMIVGNKEEWDGWQSALADAKFVERAMEGLYRCVDKRGDEMRIIISNLGFLTRRP